MNEIIIIGSGAQTKYALEILRFEKTIILTSNKDHIGKTLYGQQILKYNESYIKDDIKYVFISHGNNKEKERIYKKIVSINSNVNFIKIIHDKACISRTSSIGD